MNDGSRGTYNSNIQIRFKTSNLKSILCDYSDAYVIVKGTILVGNTTDTEVIFKSLVPLTDWRNELSNTQIDAKDIDVEMPLYNLIEYRDIYSKTCHCYSKAWGCLWQYHWNIVPLKYVSNLWITLEMHFY